MSLWRGGAMVGATAVVALVGAAAMVGMAAMGAAAGAAATSDVLLLLVVDSGGVVYLLTYTFALLSPAGVCDRTVCRSVACAVASHFRLSARHCAVRQ